MSGFYVREKHLWYQAANDKFTAMGNLIPGQVFYVVPGAAAVQGGFVRNHRKFVFNTVDLALAQCVDGRRDSIVLLPGAHTLTTAALSVAKAGVSFWGPEAWYGLKDLRPSASITPLAASDGFAISAVDVTFNGLELIPITAKNFATYTAAALRLRVKDCYLNLATQAVNIATTGFTQSGAATDLHVSGCTVLSGGAQGAAFNIVGVVNFLIEDTDCYVNAGTWAAAIKTGAGTSGKGRRCYFGGLGTSITGFSSTAAAESTNSILLNDNKAGVGHVLASGYGGANGKCVLGNNFIETVSGGTGGTLITIST